MLEIIKEGDWTLPQAVILDQAFELAKQHNTKLSSYTMNMQGMSGRKYRTLINRPLYCPGKIHTLMVATGTTAIL